MEGGTILKIVQQGIQRQFPLAVCLTIAYSAVKCVHVSYLLRLLPTVSPYGMYLQGQWRDSQQHLHDLREHLDNDHDDPEDAIAEHSRIADHGLKSLSLCNLSRFHCQFFTEYDEQHNSCNQCCQHK